MLYEIMTGKRAFEGDTPISTLAAILRAEAPDIPDDLRVVFLKPGAEYRAQVRFSNAGGFIRADDAQPDLRGVVMRRRGKRTVAPGNLPGQSEGQQREVSRQTIRPGSG